MDEIQKGEKGKVMRTPKEYTNNLNRKIITPDMLGAALYSVNKRAKNYRDRQAEYREIRQSCRMWGEYYYDRYDNETKCRLKKEEYYNYKDELLSVITPTCIHKEKNRDGVYLFYDMGNYSFHSPIAVSEVRSKYPDIEIVQITDLQTYGKCVTELVSMQFVKKMLDVVKSGDYKYDNN